MLVNFLNGIRQRIIGLGNMTRAQPPDVRQAIYNQAQYVERAARSVTIPTVRNWVQNLIQPPAKPSGGLQRPGKPAARAARSPRGRGRA